MNERIKELWDKAAQAAAAYPSGQNNSWETQVNFMDKFAELIVRECALVAKTLPHTPERHWVQDSVTYIPVHCEQNILKHFGVEG